MGTSKNRSERRKFRPRSAAVRTYGEHRRAKIASRSRFFEVTHVLGTKYVQVWSDVMTWSPDDRYRRPATLNADHARKMLAAASHLVSNL